jgi:hypothetical protein
VQASVVLTFEPRRGYDPTDLYCLAVALDSYADRLRDLADELAAILAGGGQ